MRLPVHCCCEPSKRLGWVDVPESAKPHGTITFLLAPHAGGWLDTEKRPPIMEPYQAILTTIGEIDQNIGTLSTGLAVERVEKLPTFLAVKSAHQPIATWLRVRSFVPDPDYRK